MCFLCFVVQKQEKNYKKKKKKKHHASPYLLPTSESQTSCIKRVSSMNSSLDYHIDLFVDAIPTVSMNVRTH